MIFIFKKLLNKYTWKRIFYERLTEPIHLNIISIFVLLFGSLRQKIKYDLIVRPQHAFALWAACEEAKLRGLKAITVIEFGVASGAGMMNIIEISKKITTKLGVHVNVIGFDTGTGMPPAIDYRDHPNLYVKGDFPMSAETLRQQLPANAKLVLGEVGDTIKKELASISTDAPIGFISFDLDYYSSTKDALEILKDANPEKYLSTVVVYLDDVNSPQHNEFAGVLLAVNEFNELPVLRKICKPHFLEKERIFKNPQWINHIRYAHIMDHPHRSNIREAGTSQVIVNPYLKYEGNKKVIFRN